MDALDSFAPLRADEAHVETIRPDEDLWCPVLPVPDDAPKLTKTTIEKHCPTGYVFTSRWCYRDQDGHRLLYMARYDRPANGQHTTKQFKPLTYCDGPDGRSEWRCKNLPLPRPLYGLDELAARRDAPVLIVVGEKTVTEASHLFIDHVVITSPNGSNSARKADWSPLAGRAVTIWSDNNPPGSGYAADVADMLHKAGTASVRVVQIPDGWPPGWDLADPLPPGVTEADLAKMLAKAEPVTNVGLDIWSTPIPIVSTLPPVESFTPAMLPRVLRDYVMDVADHQQSPPDFVAVAAICGVAAMVGNKFRIRPKQNDDWEVVPNLWGAIVGRPSAMKSPAMQSALAPVYALQDELRRAWEEECKTLMIEAAVSNLNAKQAKRKAEKALRAGDREEAKKILPNAISASEHPPCPRLIINDATVEKLGELLNQNANGLLLIRDELAGFLTRMEKEEFQGERTLYLEAFSGDGCFTYDRIVRGTIHIQNCTLSIIGGVQPSRIAPLVRGAMSGTSNDGLIQRLQMTVWPDDICSWRWVDRKPDRDARDAFEDVFRYLSTLPCGFQDRPHVLRFTPEAQNLYREWMEDIQVEARSGVLTSTLESHVLKMPKTVASLALIFELIDGGLQFVGEEATRLALGWADYLRSHANRLYAAGQTMTEEGARLIVERRGQLPDPFTIWDIQRKGWATLADHEAVLAAVDVLIATSHCREVRSTASPAGGRPSVRYVWNPTLRQKE